jgi:hypothetical protein
MGRKRWRAGVRKNSFSPGIFSVFSVFSVFPRDFFSVFSVFSRGFFPSFPGDFFSRGFFPSSPASPSRRQLFPSSPASPSRRRGGRADVYPGGFCDYERFGANGAPVPPPPSPRSRRRGFFRGSGDFFPVPRSSSALSLRRRRALACIRRNASHACIESPPTCHPYFASHWRPPRDAGCRRTL